MKCSFDNCSLEMFDIDFENDAGYQYHEECWDSQLAEDSRYYLSGWTPSNEFPLHEAYEPGDPKRFELEESNV